MDLNSSTADNLFRAEVMARLDAHLPADLKARVQNHRRIGKADYVRWRKMTEAAPGDTNHPWYGVCRPHRSSVSP